MRHPSAVPLALLKTLEGLQAPLLHSGFALAGGTSLALRLGHRLSVDLDFFTVDPFDPEALAGRLGHGQDHITGMATGTLQLRVNGVKVEFLRHAYPQLAPHDGGEGVRMWSLQDVVAMKLNAVSNRGSKKDFYDLVALLEHFRLPDMLGLYKAKYRPASMMMVIRSLAWFEDAEAEPDPISLNKTSWVEVRAKIAAAVRALE